MNVFYDSLVQIKTYLSRNRNYLFFKINIPQDTTVKYVCLTSSVDYRVKGSEGEDIFPEKRYFEDNDSINFMFYNQTTKYLES